jgi:hypothetical protein
MKGIALLLSTGLFVCECAAQKGFVLEGVEMIASPGRLYEADQGFALGVGICAQYERQFEYQWSVYGGADYLVFVKSDKMEIMMASVEAGLKYFPAIGGGHDIHTLRSLGKTGFFLKAGSGCVLAILGSHGSEGLSNEINPSLNIGGGYQTSQFLQIGLNGVLIGDFPHIWFTAGFRVMVKLF